MGRVLIREGDRHPAVPEIRERLRASGDLAGEPAPRDDDAADPAEADDLYDAPLARAVRAFQQRRGLLADGVVGPSTLRVIEGSRWALGDRILVHSPAHLLAGDDVA